MTGRRKLLVATLAVAIAGILSFDSYAWWTRRAAPTFSKGGAFGSATPTPSASVRPSVLGERAEQQRDDATDDPEPTEASSAAATPSPSRVDRSAGPALGVPASGRYVYDASGREDVDFGSTSACGWDVDRVTIDVKRTQDDVVMDTTIGANHQQRGIYEFDERGMFHKYFGAAVTCVGIRRTEESTYEPPMLRFAAPLQVGETWTSSSRTEGWTETTTGRVLRRERVRVPAGRFTAYVVSLEARFSDGQTGRYDATVWLVPSLGIWVKQTVDTEVHSSGAVFTSRYETRLAAMP